MTAISTEKTKWYTGLTGYHYLVLTVASLGWMFDTMDQWLYVLARQPALQDLLGPAATAGDVARCSGNVQALFILGWATGGFVFGMVGDRLGRTRTMAITVLMYALFTGLSGLAPTWHLFALFRFLTGLGIGGEFAAGASLVAEVFPDRARPTALSIMQACSAGGNVLAGLISLTVFTYVPSENGWRVIFFVGFVPALLVFAIRLFVKEPEKWHKARDEAKRSGAKLGSIVQLFKEPVLRRHTIIGVLLAAVGVIGFWGIGTFSPDLLRGVLNPDNLPELRKSANTSASIAVMAQNVGAFFGILVWGWLAQRAGRRPAFAAAFLACFIVVPLTFHMTTSYALALVLFPAMGFCMTSLFGGYAVYFPELFPTRLRSTGTGFCYNVARYISILGPSLFGALRADMGIAWAATIVSLVFIFGLGTLPFAPETRGKPLPE
ncbi:MAG TPA: MFS transporter [Candidatus Hydrogenedentes bacterium]|nr:MFS transporter [Candidatus Hydrogenedentota bacterium]HPG69851.1 MFS transporter [Candidatus Hydrogenedentota bacterium]